jgi:hypothetical protein
VASIGAIKDLVKTTDDKAEKNITDITAANTLIGDNTSLANKNKSDIANNLSLVNTNKTNIETANSNIANNESTANKNKTDIANLKTDKLDASKVNTIIPADDSKNSEAANIGAIKTYISNNISNYNSGDYININSSTKTIKVLTTSTISDTDKTNLPTCKAVADYVNSNSSALWSKNADGDLIYENGIVGKTVGIDKTTGNLYIGLGWLNNTGKESFGLNFNGNFINFRGTLKPYTYTKTAPPSEDIGRYDYQLRNVFSSNIVSGDDTNKADENLSLKSAKDGAVIIKNGTSDAAVNKLEIKGVNSTFSTNIIPNQTKTHNIGTVDNKWNEIHTENLSATNITNSQLTEAYQKAQQALTDANKALEDATKAYNKAIELQNALNEKVKTNVPTDAVFTDRYRSISNSTSSENTSTAASSYAVKAAYDKAVSVETSLNEKVKTNVPADAVFTDRYRSISNSTSSEDTSTAASSYAVKAAYDEARKLTSEWVPTVVYFGGVTDSGSKNSNVSTLGTFTISHVDTDTDYYKISLGSSLSSSARYIIYAYNNKTSDGDNTYHIIRHSNSEIRIIVRDAPNFGTTKAGFIFVIMKIIN